MPEDLAHLDAGRDVIRPMRGPRPKIRPNYLGAWERRTESFDESGGEFDSCHTESLRFEEGDDPTFAGSEIESALPGGSGEKPRNLVVEALEDQASRVSGVLPPLLIVLLDGTVPPREEFPICGGADFVGFPQFYTAVCKKSSVAEAGLALRPEQRRKGGPQGPSVVAEELRLLGLEGRQADWIF